MSKLKSAIIVCAGLLTLATGAQAYDLRLGNGSIFPIPIPSNDGAPDSARPSDPSRSWAKERVHDRARGHDRARRSR